MTDTVCSPRLMESTYEPVAAVAGQIRRRLRVLLTGWDVAAETTDDALMVVEELVANVVDHARTSFRLVVQVSGPVLRIAVRDWSDRPPHLQAFDPHAGRGRGLQLVGNLAQRWGCVRHDDGKTVWAELTT